jgi:hypothetical protein
MKPYGCENIQSPKHVKRGGAPNGWYINWNSYCRCCDAGEKGSEKGNRVLKKRARREGKKQVEIDFECDI